MAKEFKLNNRVNYRISNLQDDCKFNTKFAYIANTSAKNDDLEIYELQTHLKNIKYFLNVYDHNACTLNYNGFEIKVYKFSLTFDSIQIYVKVKHLQVSNRQFDEMHKLYKDLYKDYIKLINAETERLEIATEKIKCDNSKIQEEIDKLEQYSKTQKINALQYSSFTFSMLFIITSYLLGLYDGFDFGFYFILLNFFGMGFLAINSINKYFKAITNN